MPSPEAALALSGDNWTKIAEFTGPDFPRGYRVQNFSGSANAVEVFCSGVYNVDGDSEPVGDGEAIPPGGILEFTAHVPDVGGGHTAIWAKSIGATISHGISMR